MRRDHREDDGLGMTAGASGFIQHEAEAGIYLSVKSDPSTVVCFCHGAGIPVLYDGPARPTYTACPVWIAEKQRIAEGRQSLLDDPEPEPVSMGISTHEAEEDPWGAARRDLELLRGA